ncbi:Tumor necrosis factor receptor superfamily member 19 [Merluccius polli]|uniref:Tumor necrosis factor receptor superfamily member 19 n=1 Tax=Merluccius polli TaxID=89951 RepID=A0AA47MZJ5_MERPO|nr:Tumor necrosis factor receptor superfamily member 19 [Merluccius polli]
MESPVYIAALFTIWLSVGRSEPSCDQTQFLHYNGTCVACPECGPGQQLSEVWHDCGFGDRGTGLCVVCGRGYFSVDTGVAPCIRCTQCILLNRQQRAMCTAINNAQCGHCLPGELMPPSQESEVHPASIVINVTTNIKPSAQPEAGPYGASGPDSSYPTTQQMEQHLQTIWDTAQGQSIELLDYDTVQDLSLLLGPADRRGSTLRRLARSLGVPPQILGHLRGFPDLFHYLRTSTYLLLPQLAQAAALLPCPRVVARIHQAVMNK